jgi:hypothetical protein
MRFPALLLLLVAACACSSGHANSDPTRGRAFVARAGSPAKPSDDARIVTFTGTCDASGAVPIDARLFVVANDENNVLRIYDAERGGTPLHAIDLSPEFSGSVDQVTCRLGLDRGAGSEWVGATAASTASR